MKNNKGVFIKVPDISGGPRVDNGTRAFAMALVMNEAFTQLSELSGEDVRKFLEWFKDQLGEGWLVPDVRYKMALLCLGDLAKDLEQHVESCTFSGSIQ